MPKLSPELLALGIWVQKTGNWRWEVVFLTPLLSIRHDRKGCAHFACN